jgi:hypothetical protein
VKAGSVSDSIAGLDESVAPARPGCAVLDRAVVEELIDK